MIMRHLRSVLLAVITTAVEAQLSLVTASMNNQTYYFPAVAASFGEVPSVYGETGLLVAVKTDGCDPDSVLDAVNDIKNMTFYLEQMQLNDDLKLVTLITRGNCSFDTKVYYSQRAGADATIIHNDSGSISNTSDYTQFPSDFGAYMGLVQMSSNRLGAHVDIPSVYVSYESGYYLRSEQMKRYDMNVPFLVDITSLNVTVRYGGERGWGRVGFTSSVVDMVALMIAGMLLITMCGCCSMCSLLLTRYNLQRRLEVLELKNRVTPTQLNKIKLRTLSSSDIDAESGITTACAICLEDLAAGSVVRDLPCGHLFHSECVDDWFLHRHRNCPTCRQDIFKPAIIRSHKIESTSENANPAGQEVPAPAVSVVPPAAVAVTDIDRDAFVNEFNDHVTSRCKLFEP